MNLENTLDFLPPCNWREYMPYFGSWCGSFGTDVNVAFIHEIDAAEDGWVLTTIRFEINPGWGEWSKNVWTDTSDSGRVYRAENGSLIHLWALKFRWHKKQESKAVLAKAILSNMPQGAPFLSLGTALRTLKMNGAPFYKDFKRVSMLMHELSTKLIGYCDHKSNRFPYISLDGRLLVKIFRAVMARAVNGESLFVDVITNRCWRASDWVDILKRGNASPDHPLIRAKGSYGRDEEGIVSHHFSNYENGKATLIVAIPSFELAPMTEAITFMLKTERFSRVRVKIGVGAFSPELQLNIADTWNVISVVEKPEMGEVEAPIFNRICGVNLSSSICCTYFVLTYEGGYAPGIGSELDALASAIILNYMFTPHGLKNMVMMSTDLGDAETQRIYGSLATGISPFETTEARMARIGMLGYSSKSSVLKKDDKKKVKRIPRVYT